MKKILFIVAAIFFFGECTMKYIFHKVNKIYNFCSISLLVMMVKRSFVDFIER